MKTKVNPLTEILKQAERLILEQEAELVHLYGIPLFVEEKGEYSREALAFPKDPEILTPEEMQTLIDLHGEEAVNKWLYESLDSKYGEEAADEQ